MAVDIVSTETEDEQKQYVQRTPANPGTVTVFPAAPAAPARGQTVVTTAPVVTASPPPASQRNETVVTHRSTNMGAVVSMVVGVVVLLGGIGLIATQIPFLPWPYSLIVILGFGLILLMVGASMIGRGSEKP